MIELKSDAIYETVTTFKPALHGLKLRGGGHFDQFWGPGALLILAGEAF